MQEIRLYQTVFIAVQCCLIGMLEARCGLPESSLTCDQGYHVANCNVTDEGVVKSGHHCEKDVIGKHQDQFTEKWEFWVGLIGAALVIGIGITIFTCINKQKMHRKKRPNVIKDSDTPPSYTEAQSQHGQGHGVKENQDRHGEPLHHIEKLHNSRVSPAEQP
ncbi:uncharacterized protein [Watersipora subatra]|uniref:uncharacterized protein n=1 Tax=Watersipora subatra TaxID=2589382 RepID=UPI00355B0405